MLSHLFNYFLSDIGYKKNDDFDRLSERSDSIQWILLLLTKPNCCERIVRTLCKQLQNMFTVYKISIICYIQAFENILPWQVFQIDFYLECVQKQFLYYFQRHIISPKLNQYQLFVDVHNYNHTIFSKKYPVSSIPTPSSYLYTISNLTESYLKDIM